MLIIFLFRSLPCYRMFVDLKCEGISSLQGSFTFGYYLDLLVCKVNYFCKQHVFVYMIGISQKCEIIFTVCLWVSSYCLRVGRCLVFPRHLPREWDYCLAKKLGLLCPICSMKDPELKAESEIVLSGG